MLDNVKILLIFLVVLGHVIERLGERNLIYKIIYSFHMPLFVLITGFTFKKYIYNFDHNKIIQKTLVPYCVFQLVYSLVTKNYSLVHFILIPYYHLWYLVSLYFWCIVAYSIKSKNKIFIFVIFTLLGILSGLFPIPAAPLSNSRTLVYFPFFLIGFYLELNSLERIKRYKLYFILGLAILLLFSPYVYKNIDNQLLWGHIRYSKIYINKYDGLYLRPYLYLISTFMSFSMLSIIPDKETIFSKYGTKTFYIYTYHVLGIFVIQEILYKINFSQQITFEFKFIIAVLLTFLSSYIYDLKNKVVRIR